MTQQYKLTVHSPAPVQMWCTACFVLRKIANRYMLDKPKDNLRNALENTKLLSEQNQTTQLVNILMALDILWKLKKCTVDVNESLKKVKVSRLTN